jgi:hypothetical protein
MVHQFFSSNCAHNRFWLDGHSPRPDVYGTQGAAVVDSYLVTRGQLKIGRRLAQGAKGQGRKNSANVSGVSGGRATGRLI